MEQRNEVADFQLSDMILRALNLDEANKSQPKAGGLLAQPGDAAGRIFTKSFDLLKEQHETRKEDNKAQAEKLGIKEKLARANTMSAEGGQAERADRYHRFLA